MHRVKEGCRCLCMGISVALADFSQEFTHLAQGKGIMQCFQGVDGRYHGAPFKSVSRMLCKRHRKSFYGRDKQELWGEKTSRGLYPPLCPPSALEPAHCVLGSLPQCVIWSHPRPLDPDNNIHLLPLLYSLISWCHFYHSMVPPNSPNFTTIFSS